MTTTPPSIPQMPGGSTPQGRADALAARQEAADGAVARESAEREAWLEKARNTPMRPTVAQEEKWRAAEKASNTSVVSRIAIGLGILFGLATGVALGWAALTVDMGARADVPGGPWYGGLIDGIGNIVVFVGAVAFTLGIPALAVIGAGQRRGGFLHLVATAVGAGFMAWALYVFFDYIDDDAGSLWPPLILAGVLSALQWVMIEIGRPAQRAKDLARFEADRELRGPLMDAVEAVQFMTWGEPGQDATAESKFGKANTALGIYGEQYTAKVLEKIAAEDQFIKVFHQRQFPGSRNADIDHVVTRGSKSVLVDAKAWKLGHYSWHPDGTILRDGQKFDGGMTHMPTASQASMEKMPTGSVFPVCYVVLVPPKGAQAVATVDNTLAPDGIALATPDQVRQWLPEYLCTDEDAFLDRRLMGYWSEQWKAPVKAPSTSTAPAPKKPAPTPAAKPAPAPRAPGIHEPDARFDADGNCDCHWIWDHELGMANNKRHRRRRAVYGD